MSTRRIGAILLAFGYSVLLFEALNTGVAWWKGEIEELGLEEWLLLATLPLLAWVWWRYFSVFGRKDAACLLPRGNAVPPQASPTSTAGEPPEKR